MHPALPLVQIWAGMDALAPGLLNAAAHAHCAASAANLAAHSVAHTDCSSLRDAAALHGHLHCGGAARDADADAAIGSIAAAAAAAIGAHGGDGLGGLVWIDAEQRADDLRRGGARWELQLFPAERTGSCASQMCKHLA